MATATPDPRTLKKWQDTDRRVRHPLHAVRGWIRSYVILEGIGLSLLYITVAFWLGLGLDWGVFRAFAFDWVEELGALLTLGRADIWLRAFLLTLVVLGLIFVAVRITVMRLFREFSDHAMALLLERRFPRQLGDRLMTAVELADPRKGNRYGFSLALIEKTIRDAADRVESVPVRRVFNWGRLWRIYIYWGLLSVGLYLLIGGVSLAVAAIQSARYQTALDEATAEKEEEDTPKIRSQISRLKTQVDSWHSRISPVHYFWTFHNNAMIWFERNILLSDVYWPRQAYLEVLGFQGSRGTPDEMRVGGGEQRQELRVRAVEWAVADRKVAGGWRPLLWSDMANFFTAQELELADAVRTPPKGWVYARDDNSDPDWHQWTMDQLYEQFDNDDVRQDLSAPSREALDNIFYRLKQIARQASMARSIRRLEVPDNVTLYARGKNTNVQDSFPRVQGNQYAIGLASTESLRFTVRGLDYYTPYKYITVVPAPNLDSLTMDTSEPAYVYYRLQGMDQNPLKGLKRKVAGREVRFDQKEFTFPYGTDVVLHGAIESGRGLSDVSIVAPKETKAGTRLPPKKPTFTEGEREFDLEISNIIDTYDFVIEFRDADNVPNQRHLIVRPKADDPPSISNLELDAAMRKPKLRKSANPNASLGEAVGTFLITPEAQLPFKGMIADDVGLTNGQWVVGVELTDVDLSGEARKIDPKAPKIDPAKKPLARKSEFTYPLLAFQRWVIEQENTAVPLEKVGAPTSGRLPKVVLEWKERTDACYFDLQRQMRLKARPGEAQRRYFLTMSLSATDNNVERLQGPATSRSPNSIRFFVVSELEFLDQVADEEEELGDKLGKVYDNLKKVRDLLDEQNRRLSETNPNMEDIRNRISLVHMLLTDGVGETRDAFKTIRDLVDQLDLNRINKEKYNHVFFNVYIPLANIIDNPNKAEFYMVEDGVRKLREAAEADKAAAQAGNFVPATLAQRRAEVAVSRQQVNTLMGNLFDVVKLMKQSATWDSIRKRANEQLEAQKREADRWKALEKKEIEKILNDLKIK